MKNANYVVTVVIPVFNGEKFLEKCLRSVFVQTYHNIEICMILDKSTDESLSLMHKLLSDSDINAYKYRIIEKAPTERGLGKSRNIAFDQVTTDFIYFLDCDDFVEPNAIEDLVLVSKKHNVDIVCASHKTILNGKIVEETKFIDDVYVGDSISNTFFAKNIFYSPYVWNKLYKKDFIDRNNLRFPEFVLEDGVFTFRELKFASSIGFSSSLTYNYVVHAESITQSILRNNMTLEVARSSLNVRDIIIKESHTGYVGDSQKIDACVFGIVHIFRDAASSSKITDIEKKNLYEDALNMPAIKLRYFSQHIKYRSRSLLIYLLFMYLSPSLLHMMLGIKKYLK